MINPGHEPETITRILFQDFPAWMMVTFYLAAATAVGVFCYGCYVQVRKYRRGKPLSPTDVGAGVKRMIADMLSHRTLKRRDQTAGKIHGLIFFGFAALFIGTATITLEYDILSNRCSASRFWYGEFLLVVFPRLWMLPATGTDRRAFVHDVPAQMARTAETGLCTPAGPHSPDDPDYDRNVLSARRLGLSLDPDY